MVAWVWGRDQKLTENGQQMSYWGGGNILNNCDDIGLGQFTKNLGAIHLK